MLATVRTVIRVRASGLQALAAAIACLCVACCLGAVDPAFAGRSDLGSQPILGPGSHGRLVVDWQRVLNAWLDQLRTSSAVSRGDRQLLTKFHGRLRVDGVFGSATEAATIGWQHDAYVPASGVVTLRTWITWIGSHVTCCGAGYPDFTAVIADGKNSRTPNAYVAWWQVALGRWSQQHGLRAVTVNGVYDSVTGAATVRFQRSVGLKPTGMANKGTWTKMAKARNALALP